MAAIFNILLVTGNNNNEFSNLMIYLSSLICNNLAGGGLEIY